MILGIDTSNYTTSACVIDEAGQIVYESASLLKVKKGQKGLRQSEAFFQHVHQLTTILEDLSQQVDIHQITCVAVSEKPRNVEGSYMPVFNAGVLFSKNFAIVNQADIKYYTHQEGHLMAAMATSSLGIIKTPFLGMHLSGGTTEILKSHWEGDRIFSEIVGGTLDLNFGQLIDRIGVAAGLEFPCGAALDKLAQSVETKEYIQVKAVQAGHFNISGLENQLMKRLETEPMDKVARVLFNTIAALLSRLIETYDKTLPLVISGGVSSNSIIREWLKMHCKRQGQIVFATPQYAKDNAYGIALLGSQEYTKC